jgi:MFS family permease
MTSPAVSNPAIRAHRVRAVVASTVGTTIEWYDFFLYLTASALVFPKVFFPGSTPLNGVLLSFGTQFVGFAARPIGAAIFGHYGDRIGRKGTLIATLLLMGVATVLMGVLPGAATRGVTAAVLLIILRVLQGIGVGGEWGGSVLLSMEWGRQHRRGFMASWPQVGVPIGLILSTAMVKWMSAVAGPSFLTWGWRVPFLASVVLLGIGLYVRLRVLESPAFSDVKRDQAVAAQPVWQVLREQPREVLTSAFVRMSEQAPFYIFTAFIFAYAVGTLHMSRDLILSAVLAASCVSFVTIPLSGHISDRIGRRKMYLIGAATVGLFGFLYFGMVDTAIPSAVFIAIVLSLIPHDMQYGPQAALIAEAFTPRLRYSGASLGYQLASVIAGGPAPLIATALFATYHSGYAISIYIAACAVISLVAASFMPDYTGQDISIEYDD